MKICHIISETFLAIPDDKPEVSPEIIKKIENKTDTQISFFQVEDIQIKNIQLNKIPVEKENKDSSNSARGNKALRSPAN